MHTALLLFPDFALIALGAGLRRAFHLGDHFWIGLEKLVYFILFPALLFNAITRQAIDLAAALPLALGGAGIMGCGILLALGVRPLLHLPPMQYASLFQCGYRFNSYIALAIAGKLNGAAGIAAMGLVCGVTVPFANASAVWMLARHSEKGLLKELASNPLIVGTVAGLIWSATGLGIAEPIRAFLGRLSDASIALGLMSVGAALKLRGGLPGLRIKIAAGAMMTIKLALLPALTLVALPHVGLTPVQADTLLIYATLPVASSAYILAQRMGGDGQSVAWVISATTLLAMVTMSLWLSLGIHLSQSS